MEEASWRRNHGEGIIYPGGGIMEKESWRRYPGGIILEEESWRRRTYPGRGIMDCMVVSPLA